MFLGSSRLFISNRTSIRSAVSAKRSRVTDIHIAHDSMTPNNNNIGMNLKNPKVKSKSRDPAPTPFDRICIFLLGSYSPSTSTQNLKSLASDAFKRYEGYHRQYDGITDITVGLNIASFGFRGIKTIRESYRDGAVKLSEMTLHVGRDAKPSLADWTAERPFAGMTA